MHRIFAVFGVLCLSLAACSSSQDSSSSPPASFHAGLSKEVAAQCVDAGDLNCAQTQYCGIRAVDESDGEAGVHCCLSQFLNAYFSDNTRELGKMLGYDPAPFSQVQNTPLQELLAKKRLPFGELFLQSSKDAPDFKALAVQWARSLTVLQGSSADLNGRVKKLGAHLEAVQACWEQVLPKLTGSSVELKKNFFDQSTTIPITSRDVKFLSFATGAVSYLTQSIFEYEWGFSRFPAWPPVESFYADINGHAGEGDLRFGDLSQSGIAAIIDRSTLLRKTFDALSQFALSSEAPGAVDSWLTWRFSADTISTYRAVFTAAGDSLSSGQWTPISGSDDSVNFSSLLQSPTLPNANHIPEGIDLLVKDSQNVPAVNHTYWEFLFQNLVKKTP